MVSRTQTGLAETKIAGSSLGVSPARTLERTAYETRRMDRTIKWFEPRALVKVPLSSW